MIATKPAQATIIAQRLLAPLRTRTPVITAATRPTHSAIVAHGNAALWAVCHAAGEAIVSLVRIPDQLFNFNLPRAAA